MPGKNEVSKPGLFALAVVLLFAACTNPKGGVPLPPDGSGTGTAADPFIVGSRETFEKVARHSTAGTCLAGCETSGEDCEYKAWTVSAHYRQIADIDMDGVTGFIPIGDVTNPFTGSYDGGGGAVRDLGITQYVTTTVGGGGSGLFGQIGSDTAAGTIKNLGLENIKIITSARAGSIAAYNHRGTILNCYAIGTVTSTGYLSLVGGIVGGNGGGGIINANHPDYMVIQNSYFHGTVSSTDTNVGGIAGSNHGIIRNCYAVGEVAGTQAVGGIAGNVNRTWFGNSIEAGGLIENCYSTASVSGISSIGGVVGAIAGGNTVPSTLRNSLALNSGITGGTNSNTGRVTGATSVSASLSNNYARSDMTVTGSGYSPDIGHDKKDGVDVNAGQYNQNWWRTSANWDFNTVWRWGPNNLPVLRNVGGPQNHTLP